MRKLVTKLMKTHDALRFCDEAGPSGDNIHRQLTKIGDAGDLVGPSLTPWHPGHRVKTDRRDAVVLARLHSTGGLRLQTQSTC